MAFYALFASVVVLPRGRALMAIGVALVVAVAMGAVVPGPSALWFWTRPIILDFGLGLAVGALLGRGLVLAPVGRIALAVVGAVLLLADPAHLFDGAAGVTVANEWPRVICAGLPVAMLLAAAVLGPEPAMPRVLLPAALVGDASYPLYLFHPFALILTEKLAQKAPVVRDAAGWQLVAFMMVVALGVAFAAHRWIERPMTTHLARRAARVFPPLPRPLAAPSGE